MNDKSRMPKVRLTYDVPQEVIVTTTVTLHGESPEDPAVVDDVVLGIMQQIRDIASPRIRVILATRRGHCCPILFRSVQRAMNTLNEARGICLSRAGC